LLSTRPAVILPVADRPCVVKRAAAGASILPEPVASLGGEGRGRTAHGDTPSRG